MRMLISARDDEGEGEDEVKDAVVVMLKEAAAAVMTRSSWPVQGEGRGVRVESCELGAHSEEVA